MGTLCVSQFKNMDETGEIKDGWTLKVEAKVLDFNLFPGGQKQEAFIRKHMMP